jgi:hypothetical protein
MHGQTGEVRGLRGNWLTGRKHWKSRDCQSRWVEQIDKIHEPEKKVGHTRLSCIQMSLLHDLMKNNSWGQRPVIPLDGQMEHGRCLLRRFLVGEIVRLEIIGRGNPSSPDRSSGRSLFRRS